MSDDIKEVPGITTAMMVALGKADIKTLEDLASFRHRRPRWRWNERKRTARPCATRVPRARSVARGSQKRS